MHNSSDEYSVRLNTGNYMPRVGLGVWKAKDGDEVEQAVAWALKSGYRMIDTAKYYGNEGGVGRAIAKSHLERSKIFVTTKLEKEEQGYVSTLESFKQSLAKLNTSYVDLYLVHWPYISKEKTDHKRRETWMAMEALYRSGLAKAVGVSNYTISHLEEMKSYATILPSVNQIEFHPFLYQKDMLDYCIAHGITLQAYCPLVRSQKMSDIVIASLAKKYSKTSAQILLKWSLQKGCVAIPKSVNQHRIAENINIFDFSLEIEDINRLDDLNENLHVAWNPN